MTPAAIKAALVDTQRVFKTVGALYGKPRRSRRRRRCHGHLADTHHIEIGDWCITTSLPPNNSEIGNEDWWHMTLCADCWPADIPTPKETPDDH